MPKYILNPETGRYVLASGRLGKSISKQQEGYKQKRSPSRQTVASGHTRSGRVYQRRSPSPSPKAPPMPFSSKQISPKLNLLPVTRMSPNKSNRRDIVDMIKRFLMLDR